jgi:DNA-binding NarL/FixJ family response regulator
MKNSLNFELNDELKTLLDNILKAQMNGQYLNGSDNMNIQNLDGQFIKTVRDLCNYLQLKKHTATIGKLSDREIHLIRTLCEGKTTEEIAASLHISKHTVETHLGRIFSKVDVHNARQLMAWAYRVGLVD